MRVRGAAKRPRTTSTAYDSALHINNTIKHAPRKRRDSCTRDRRNAKARGLLDAGTPPPILEVIVPLAPNAKAVTVTPVSQETFVMLEAVLLTASTSASTVGLQVGAWSKLLQATHVPTVTSILTSTSVSPASLLHYLFSRVGAWCKRTGKPSAGNLNLSRMHVFSSAAISALRPTANTGKAKLSPSEEEREEALLTFCARCPNSFSSNGVDDFGRTLGESNAAVPKCARNLAGVRDGNDATKYGPYC